MMTLCSTMLAEERKKEKRLINLTPVTLNGRSGEQGMSR
jgi:hypothetical protein